MSAQHPAWGAARRFVRALASRDLRRLTAATALPLLVRYPDHYKQPGDTPVYAIDGRALDAAARSKLLGKLLLQFPRGDEGDEDTDLSVLGRHARADAVPLPDGALRVRFCADYNHLGDGTYDEIELTLRRSASQDWQVQGVEISWVQQS